MKFVIVKFKNAIIPFCLCVFTLFLVMYSTNNLIAAKNGLILWALSVVPSLFPFFIATELLSYTNIIPFLGKMLNKLMKPLFNVPGEGSFALIMGILSGYPVGAKIVSNLKRDGICSNIECERLIAFTNNSGPLFIIGTIGISMYSSQEIGLKLFIVHILSCIIVGFLFRWWKSSSYFNINCKYDKDVQCTPLHKSTSYLTTSKLVSFHNLGEILSCSIQSAINSILVIGGFVVLFSVVVSILSSSQMLNILSNVIAPILNMFHIPEAYSNSVIIGLIEVTNGLKIAVPSGSNISIIICSFLLGCGGISVLLQVLSITSKAKISIKPYIIGKFLQGIISTFLMWVLLR